MRGSLSTSPEKAALVSAWLDLDASLEPWVEQAKKLTVFAWVFRYPGDVAAPPPSVAVDALGIAQHLHGQIKKRLPQDYSPTALF
jgi:hypothetical protein